MCSLSCSVLSTSLCNKLPAVKGIISAPVGPYTRKPRGCFKPAGQFAFSLSEHVYLVLTLLLMASASELVQ